MLSTDVVSEMSTVTAYSSVVDLAYLTKLRRSFVARGGKERGRVSKYRRTGWPGCSPDLLRVVLPVNEHHPGNCSCVVLPSVALLLPPLLVNPRVVTNIADRPQLRRSISIQEYSLEYVLFERWFRNAVCILTRADRGASIPEVAVLGFVGFLWGWLTLITMLRGVAGV